MEYFLDHLAFVFIIAMAMLCVLAVLVAIGEYVDKKLDGKFKDYVVRFFGGE